jgi:hypothetical protein
MLSVFTVERCCSNTKRKFAVAEPAVNILLSDLTRDAIYKDKCNFLVI